MLEYVQFQRWFIDKFSGGIAPIPPYWGGATAPLPRPHSLGAPALRASRASLGTFGPSIVRPWYDFRHTNPEMLPAPLPIASAYKLLLLVIAIVTLALSCTVSGIRRLIGWKSSMFHAPHLTPSIGVTPFELWKSFTDRQSRVLDADSENLMIIGLGPRPILPHSCVVLIWQHGEMDRRHACTFAIAKTGHLRS